MPSDLLNSALIRLAAFTASGVMLWYGTGLHPIWWLTWIAPLPVLLAAVRAKPIDASLIAFGAWGAAGMNTWQYMHGLLGVPIWLSFLSIFGPALVFAISVTVWRALSLRQSPIRATVGFAGIWVCYEFAIQKLSVHSTWGNLAYSQMDCLPVVQTSALAGVAGISFLLFLVPGTIAGVVFAPRHRVVAALPLILPLLLICWGAMRLREPPAGPTIKVGLIASDAPANLRPRDPARIQTTFEAYAAEAQALIRQGARLIVIPEKTAVVSGNTVGLLDRILSAPASTGATVAAGVERWTDAAKLNELRVYGPNGKLQAVYEKHHMLPAFEGALLPGSSLTILSEPSGTWGLEI